MTAFLLAPPGGVSILVVCKDGSWILPTKEVLSLDAPAVEPESRGAGTFSWSRNHENVSAPAPGQRMEFHILDFNHH